MQLSLFKWAGVYPKLYFSFHTADTFQVGSFLSLCSSHFSSGLHVVYLELYFSFHTTVIFYVGSFSSLYCCHFSSGVNVFYVKKCLFFSLAHGWVNARALISFSSNPLVSSLVEKMSQHAGGLKKNPFNDAPN